MPKILIVEDEESMLEILSDHFTREGFDVLEAKNGEEGLERALKEHPDLILLDMVMPKMDGMTTMKTLRKDAWGKDVPIILLTNLSAADEGIIRGMVENEPACYLVKSNWSIEDIIKKVKERLGLP